MGSARYTWSIPGGASLSLMDKMVAEKEVSGMISGIIAEEDERVRKLLAQQQAAVKNLEHALQNKMATMQSMDAKGIGSGSVRCGYNNTLNTYKWNVGRLNAMASELTGSKQFRKIVQCRSLKRQIEVKISVQR